MTTATTFRVGEIVTPKPEYAKPGTNKAFRVTKVNPKNLRCEPVDGVGRGLNYPAYALQPFSATVPATVVPYEPPLGIGTVVTLVRPYRKYTTETPLVVLADKSIGGQQGRVNVAALGGSGGQEYLRIPRAGLVVRDVEWLRGVL